MPMHRKNTSRRLGDRHASQPWFDANVRRQRSRDKMAKESRKKNRPKK